MLSSTSQVLLLCQASGFINIHGQHSISTLRYNIKEVLRYSQEHKWNISQLSVGDSFPWLKFKLYTRMRMLFQTNTAQSTNYVNKGYNFCTDYTKQTYFHGTMVIQFAIGLSAFLYFLVKIPMYTDHIWLKNTHGNATHIKNTHKKTGEK